MILETARHAPTRLKRYVVALNRQRRTQGSPVRYGLRWSKLDPLAIYLVRHEGGETAIVACWRRVSGGWKGYSFQPNRKDVPITVN